MVNSHYATPRSPARPSGVPALPPKGSAHVRTMPHTRSFRACRNSTGAPLARFDRGRLCCEEGKLASRCERRQWLIEQHSRATRPHRRPPQRSLRTRPPGRRNP